MQNDEKADVANFAHSPSRKIGFDEGAPSAKKQAHDEIEMRLLLQKASPPIDWNPSIFDSITKLNLPDCGLSSLPASLSIWLPNLSILFCPKNKFEELPAAIGSCPKLQVNHDCLSIIRVKSSLLTHILSDGVVQVQWHETYSSGSVATTVALVDSHR